jgi:hypothetical protein
MELMAGIYLPLVLTAQVLTIALRRHLFSVNRNILHIDEEKLAYVGISGAVVMLVNISSWVVAAWLISLHGVHDSTLARGLFGILLLLTLFDCAIKWRFGYDISTWQQYILEDLIVVLYYLFVTLTVTPAASLLLLGNIGNRFLLARVRRQYMR